MWVEPMQWMEELSEGCTQGKLYCPRYIRSCGVSFEHTTVRLTAQLEVDLMLTSDSSPVSQVLVAMALVPVGTLVVLENAVVLYTCSCRTRLGSYNWAGSQSESGAWVTPAFQLHHSKLDVMSAQAATPSGLRRPFFGTTTQQMSLDSAQAVPQVAAAIRMTSSSPDIDDVSPIDATRTTSEAGHVAAQIDATLERPGVIPSS